MSLLGVTVGIIGKVIQDAVKRNQAKKKVKALEASRDRLDEAYRENLERDNSLSVNRKKAEKAAADAREQRDESLNSLVFHQARSAEKQVAGSAENNRAYGEALKEADEELLEKEKKRREKLQNEYESERKAIDRKIEANGGSSTPAKLIFDSLEKIIR